MNNLEGKVFVFTGSFPGNKSTWNEFVEDNGGIVRKTISKNTNYLVIGDSPGSKVEKAKKLNINMIDINKLGKMI